MVLFVFWTHVTMIIFLVIFIIILAEMLFSPWVHFTSTGGSFIPSENLYLQTYTLDLVRCTSWQRDGFTFRRLEIRPQIDHEYQSECVLMAIATT